MVETLSYKHPGNTDSFIYITKHSFVQEQLDILLREDRLYLSMQISNY